MKKWRKEKQPREAFVQALVTACQEKNYDKITVQDISQKANLNRQTFYYHFKDKDDLLHYAYYQRGLQYLISEELALTNWEESVLKMLKKMQLCHQFYLNTVKAKPEVLTKEFNELARVYLFVYSMRLIGKGAFPDRQRILCSLFSPRPRRYFD